MAKYIIRRLVEFIPTLLVITLGSFLLLQGVPGGPIGLYTQNPAITGEDLNRLEHAFGLDQPAHVQYLRWLGRLLHGDWGYSLIERRPVLTIVRERLGSTLYLAGLGLLVGLLVSIPVGTLSAYRQYSLLDYVTTSLALIGYSLPIFWSGLIAIIVFTVWLRWFPAGGMYTLGQVPTITDRLRHTVLPVSVLALFHAGYYTRFVRASVLEVLGCDYLRTARAKGLTERQVLVRHAAKNAAIPIVTLVALNLPGLFAGALFTETIFTWPGMGRLFWQAAMRRDYPVLMALVTITAILVILSNLVADIAYALLDPQVRL